MQILPLGKCRGEDEGFMGILEFFLCLDSLACRNNQTQKSPGTNVDA